MTGTTDPTGKVQFISHHLPTLFPGEYTVKIAQDVTSPGKITSGNTFSAEHDIYVAGQRFSLDPQAVITVFPPNGSTGDFDTVLPHIVLKRSTLPWERHPVAGATHGAPTDPARPWLVLLVFDETDGVSVESVALSSLKAAKTGWPGVTLEVGQHDDDRVMALKVKAKVLKDLMPTLEDLPLTAHVRQGTDDNDVPDSAERATIIANRLPRKGAVSEVHLVSVEGRYSAQNGFELNGAGADDDVTFVSLQSWRLSCPDHTLYQITAAALSALSGPNSTVPAATVTALSRLSGLPPQHRDAFDASLSDTLGDQDAGTYGAAIRTAATANTESFKGLLLGLNRDPATLRLPPKRPDGADAATLGILENHLSLGATLLPHNFRQGDKLMSWYHGPLVPGPMTVSQSLPARTADELLRYDEKLGMLDTSYAAAWELGRLMALQSKSLSTALYNWKRAQMQQLKQMAVAGAAHLPNPGGHTAAQLAIPTDLQTALDRLAQLKGVPFSYLVPDADMLPKESIRFFHVDSAWVETLLDGAFSVGRVTEADRAQDPTKTLLSAAKTAVTGFLLRSDVVSGWPDMQIDGYGAVEAADTVGVASDTLEIVRMDRLSPGVLLCLFKGTVMTVDLHLKPEILHFGVDRNVGDDTTFSKELRNNQGVATPGLVVNPIPSRAPSGIGNRVVDMRGLADQIISLQGGAAASFTSGNFALEMIEGVEKVRLRSGN